MIRKIIKINKDRCNGCGLCAAVCHEGAISMVDGKAQLLKDDYCDGLGDCLPVCPTQAITFEKREAAKYTEEVVKKRMKLMKKVKIEDLPCGCPGTHSKTIEHSENIQSNLLKEDYIFDNHLNQWPVQIKLIPINAPYFENANLLVAADCSAYAYSNFHDKFMKNKITIIGCPKLDEVDYSKKLTEILKQNNIKSVTVIRMEVPCCGGIENAVKMALRDSGKMIQLQVITISTNGSIIE